MRNLLEPQIDRHRRMDAGVIALMGDAPLRENGFFELPGQEHPQVTLRVLVSVGEGWDHVSVSTRHRCPSWDEMEYVKRLFFEDDETVMQLHVPPSAHVNYHPYCLHLWRPLVGKIPRPPAELVGGA